MLRIIKINLGMILPIKNIIQRVIHILRHLLFLSIFVQQRLSIDDCFKYIGPDNSMIDENHLTQYPYCGSMYQKHTMATSRISNAKDATKTYRWVVMISRWNVRAPKFVGDPVYSECAGTVITDR